MPIFGSLKQIEMEMKSGTIPMEGGVMIMDNLYCKHLMVVTLYDLL